MKARWFRRGVGVAGVAVFVALAGFGVAGEIWRSQWEFGVGRSAVRVVVGHGAASVATFERPGPDLRMGQVKWIMRWVDWEPTNYWMPTLSGGGLTWHASLPLWIPMVAAAGAGVWGVWGWRRVRKQHCAKCGYDLRGLSGGVCPECGARVERAVQAGNNIAT
jgi:hypothetical protein